MNPHDEQTSLTPAAAMSQKNWARNDSRRLQYIFTAHFHKNWARFWLIQLTDQSWSTSKTINTNSQRRLLQQCIMNVELSLVLSNSRLCWLYLWSSSLTFTRDWNLREMCTTYFSPWHRLAPILRCLLSSNEFLFSDMVHQIVKIMDLDFHFKLTSELLGKSGKIGKIGE